MILDTCTLLWLATGSKELSQSAMTFIEKNSRRLFVSAITFLEIGIKVRRGKLTLPCELEEWTRAVIDHHELTEIEVTSSICCVSSTLPLIHNDPFDRLIIGTAIEYDMAIVTPDPVMQVYPRIRVMW